jgi:low temperature requirement protein LtrA
MANARRAGHAETPIILGIISVLAGLLWATIYVAKHEALALIFKVLAFVLSPLVGLFFVAIFVTLFLLVGLIGFWLDEFIAKRKTRKTK